MKQQATCGQLEVDIQIKLLIDSLGDSVASVADIVGYLVRFSPTTEKPTNQEPTKTSTTTARAYEGQPLFWHSRHQRHGSDVRP